jgi:uncharacterized protein
VRTTNFADEARIALDGLADRLSGISNPAARLGVTGLSRAGKTVFITALVHNLIHGGRLPLFDARHNGRIANAFLEPQPDDAVPRFDYESHVRELVDARNWPQSTRAISELRLTIKYESASGWNRLFSGGSLSLDIVDYPGEWLLDLPLLGLADLPLRHDLSQEWRDACAAADLYASADEMKAKELAELFTRYLRACREDGRALSVLPPGRFLMPGDLEGSPALTFAPLSLTDGKAFGAGSLAAMMAALRGLQDACGEAVLPRAYCPA